MNFIIEVHGDEIRDQSSKIYAAGQGIGADSRELGAQLRVGGWCGSDRIGQAVRAFYEKTADKSTTYVREVGEATEDTAIALGEIADEYDRLRDRHLSAVKEIADSVVDLGLA